LSPESGGYVVAVAVGEDVGTGVLVGVKVGIGSGVWVGKTIGALFSCPQALSARVRNQNMMIVKDLTIAGLFFNL
jgi:hypothetical protein